MAQYSRKLSKGTFWFYKLNYKGKVYRSLCNFKSKFEAKKAESKHLLLLNEQRVLPIYDEIFLKDLIDYRLKYIKSKKSDHYHKENKIYLNILIEYLGNVKVNSVTRHNINELLIQRSIEMKIQGSGVYSVNSMLRIYKALFNYGINILELKIDNPCKNLQFFSIDNKVKYIPSDDEISQLLAVCDEGQEQLIRFVMETGCRINEALNLRFNDVLNDTVILYTRKSRNSNLTPRKVPKPVCINSLAIPEDKSQRVFNRWSELPRFIEKKLIKMKKEPWGWHNLRHRYASMLSKAGKPLFDIMSLLGHSNLSTTQKYLQLLP
ncbi:MAG: site-specific integrase [Candidatus Kapabacteria bacterium]|nr:site-specific integrase [Candidatus Kapabacteria bacterium]